MKTCEICNVDCIIDDGGSTMGFIAKGTWELPEMIAAIKWIEGDDYEVPSDSKVEHCTMRCIPIKKDGDFPAYNFMYEYSKPGRGAFQASVIYLD